MMRYRSPPAPAGHTGPCTGHAEPHVRYDWRTRTYQAEFRCGCRKLCRTSRQRHETFGAAEEEAQAMGERVPT